MLLASIVLAATVAAPVPGSLAENVASRADATQTYTLYLPPSYAPSDKRPLLFVFDPRGRGSEAAVIFRAGAEQLGWVIISSNQTRSDDDGAANERAVRALLPEAARYGTDPRRVYATGFSGTAILANAVGLNTGALAGVIGVGGRLVEIVAPEKFDFAHYGLAGDGDFNNREMRALDARLERAGKTHRFSEFSGTHQWASAERASEAMLWMEVIAIREGRRPADQSVVARAYSADLQRAAEAEAGQRYPEALREYRAIVRTYTGLRDVGDVAQTIARLEKDAVVRRALKEEAKWDAFEADYASEVFATLPAIFARLRSGDTPVTTARVARELRIPDLKRRAKKGGAEGKAAERILEAAFAQTSFYLMRLLMEKQEYALAGATLGVAAEIHPDRPHVWYNMGAAWARAGDRRQALDSLQQAITLGFRDAAHLSADEDFASLREEARYRDLMARIQ